MVFNKKKPADDAGVVTVKTALGMEMDDGLLRAVCLDTVTRDGMAAWRLRGAGERSIDGTASMSHAQTLGELLREIGVAEGTYAGTCIGGRQVHAATVSVPGLSNIDWDETCRNALGNILPFPVDQAAVAWIEAGPDPYEQQHSRAVVSMIDRKLFDANKELMLSTACMHAWAGVHAELCRTMPVWGADDDATETGTQIIIHGGPRIVYIVFTSRNNPLYCRSVHVTDPLPMGADGAYVQLGSGSVMDEVIRQILISISYYRKTFEHAAFSGIHCSGLAAHEPMADTLADETDLQVAPITAPWLEDANGIDVGRYAVAISAARCAAEERDNDAVFVENNTRTFAGWARELFGGMRFQIRTTNT